MNRPKMSRVRGYLQRLGGRHRSPRRHERVNWPSTRAVGERGPVELVGDVDVYVSSLKSVLVGVHVFRDRLDAEQRHALDAIAQVENVSERIDADELTRTLDYAEAARDYMDVLEGQATASIKMTEFGVEILAERYELARQAFVGRPRK